MTWGDTAREATRQHGYLFFSDVLKQITAQLPTVAFPAIAAACAERLLTRHLQLPASMHRPFTLTCREPLDCMWGVLVGQTDADARAEVERWLQSFHDSPLNLCDGQDGPDDADHDPAAAVVYAAESLIGNSAESAGYAMSRLIDDAFSRAADAREASKPATGQVDEFIADCCHPHVQSELRWLQSVFDYIQTNSPSQATVTELRHQANA